MATPVGHYLLGLSIARLVARDGSDRRQAPWWALVAGAPDLDVLPGLAVGNLSRFHHGASHSVAAAALAALAATAFTLSRGRRASWRILALVFALYISHTVLDVFTVDTGVPIGVPLFWPWSQETFQAPWALLPHVQHTEQPLISVHNALLMVREVLIFAPLVGLVFAARAPVRRERVTAWACAAWFLMAAGLSFASLR
jgi:membrane-bound metal-dependent hydrolase YbcI (DUF457 family)